MTFKIFIWSPNFGQISGKFKTITNIINFISKSNHFLPFLIEFRVYTGSHRNVPTFSDHGKKTKTYNCRVCELSNFNK